MDTNQKYAASISTDVGKGRAKNEERGAAQGKESQVADVMECGAMEQVTDAESEGPVTAKDSLSSSK